MLSYCLKCTKNIESSNPKASKTSSRNKAFVEVCPVKNISRFINGEEISRPLSRLKMGIPLKKIPLLGQTKC